MTGDKFSHPWCTGKLSTDAGGSKRAQALYKSMTDWEVVCIFMGDPRWAWQKGKDETNLLFR